MAGSGRRVFSPGEVLTSSNVMNYLMDQSIMNFAGTAARGSAIGTAVSEGMVSYLQDTDSVEVYRAVGTAAPAWSPVAFESYVDSVSGLVPVTAGTATVAGAGSSITVNDSGTITFTNATSLTLDDVFTSEYRNYRVMLDFLTSTGNDITFRFRDNGSTNSTADYATGYPYLATGTWTVTGSGVGLTSAMFFRDTVTTQNNISVDFFAPMISDLRSQYLGNFARARNIGIVTGGLQTASETDGFVLIPSTGSFSGALSIYGYN